MSMSMSMSMSMRLECQDGSLEGYEYVRLFWHQQLKSLYCHSCRQQSSFTLHTYWSLLALSSSSVSHQPHSHFSLLFSLFSLLSSLAAQAFTSRLDEFPCDGMMHHRFTMAMCRIEIAFHLPQMETKPCTAVHSILLHEARYMYNT